MLLIFRQVVFYREKKILEVVPPAPSRSLSITFSKDCSILSVALLLIYIPLSKRIIKRMNHTTQINNVILIAFFISTAKITFLV